MPYFQPTYFRQRMSSMPADVQKIFARQLFEIRSGVDRGFSYLMLLQWLTCVLIGYFWTPLTWLGELTTGPENALLGFVFGGLFALPPIYCTWVLPGQSITRYAIAVGQSCFSILIIHLSGGRIETHFHIFVSLAALAFYQDMGVVLIMSVVVIGDHLLRGYFLPLSIYGTTTDIQWRWLEHTAWVVFENIIVFLGIRRIKFELGQMAQARVDVNEVRERALKLAAVKSDFLSKMSHEIRTPLNSIIGFSDILQETRLDKDQADYVETIHRCSDTLLHLINDVLDLSKIENGLLQIDRHRFSFREVIEDVRRMFIFQCHEKNLLLEVKIDPRVPEFTLGDSFRIRQVLINLAGNAVKFTPRGRIQITLTIDTNNNVYVCEVTDTGIGIKKENLEKIFESYRQENASIARNFGGTGLGLHISKSLIELMNGTLSVRSQEQEGCTFTFTLPLDSTTH